MKTLFPLRALITLCIILFHTQAGASDLHSLTTDANEAWRQKNYAHSQAIFTRIVNVYGPRAKVLYGSKFGVIYYRKGLTELKLANEVRKAGKKADARKWFALARESFRICYEDFPNQVKAEI